MTLTRKVIFSIVIATENSARNVRSVFIHFRFRVTRPPISFDVICASRQPPIRDVQVTGTAEEKMAAAKNGKSGLLEKVRNRLVCCVLMGGVGSFWTASAGHTVGRSSSSFRLA